MGAFTDVSCRRGGGDIASWFTTTDPIDCNVIGAFRATFASEAEAARVADKAKETFTYVVVDGRTVHAKLNNCAQASFNPPLINDLMYARDILILTAAISDNWYLRLRYDGHYEPQTIVMPSFEGARMVTGDTKVTINGKTITWKRDDLNALGVPHVPTWYDSQRYEQFEWEE